MTRRLSGKQKKHFLVKDKVKNERKCIQIKTN